MDEKYDFQKLENKWRPYWSSIDLYKTGTEVDKPKYYILDYFPYPSGDGLSVGHCRNYVPTCVSARFKRKRGFNVLHPMGWDAFGLPAENYAIDHGTHPAITSARHCATYRRQMKLVECSYDWSREFSSTDPEYYRWTQWIFLLLFQRGLAYQSMGSQWWCSKDKTILANEQVIDGRCWRCDTLVSKKELKQWYFRITDYAELLLDDLDSIDWPEPIKLMQRNWIGRSEGVEVIFKAGVPAQSQEVKISAFTTRADTLFGVTFLVLAPEHPLTTTLTTEDQRDQVTAYIEQAQRMTEIDRLATDQSKSGVFTGAYARHPITGAQIPIWVADYVLMGYGSGAVMGVPAHDTRDFAFAQQFNLPIVEVVSPDGESHGPEACYTDPGLMINSGAYSGLSSAEGGRRVTADLKAKVRGQEQITYKMRDWLISRQRYWGPPIPIIHCSECGPVAVPAEDLPVMLPDTDDFAPTDDGRSPWYFLRFASPDYEEGPFEPEAMNYWLPVDTYVGGAEHAVMHLLYSRFWTKVMYDAGLLPFTEPFSQLRNQGVLHAADGLRMSKSKGNVVTPDEVAARHGTDALRAFILFIGPFDGDVIWNDTNIKGVDRFLERYWKLADEIKSSEIDQGPADQRSQAPALNDVEEAFRREIHRVIKRLTGDYEQFKFNTAVAELMRYLNYLVDQRREIIRATLWREALETLTQLLCPIAPFITEEIWQEVLGYKEGSVHQIPWPEFDEALTVADEIDIMVQINGKLRDKITVPADIADEQLRALVLDRDKVKKYIDGKQVRQTVIVPKRLVNVVVM
jgi:leucyl-tRNA synthetase